MNIGSVYRATKGLAEKPTERGFRIGQIGSADIDRVREHLPAGP